MMAQRTVKSFLVGAAIDDGGTRLLLSQMDSCDMSTAGRDILHSYMVNLQRSESFTYGHSVRVAWLCLLFASWLDMSQGDIALITTLGMLHDIGKIGMPESVLNKNGKLTTKEFELIKEHPRYSAKWLNAADCFDESIIDIVASHHEKENGTGYPRGIKANAIAKFAKILAICDIFEALTAERPYKTPLPVIESLDLMQGMVSRGEIDPVLFGVFKSEMEGLYLHEKMNLTDGLIYRNVDVRILGYDNRHNAPICQIIERVDSASTI